MKYWNYRVIYKKDKKTQNPTYQIYEVYYSKKGKIISWSKEPVSPNGESEKELKKQLKIYKSAFELPILKEKKKGKKIVLVEINN